MLKRIGDIWQGTRMNKNKQADLLCLFFLILFCFIFFIPMLISQSIATVGDGTGYETQFKFIKMCLERGENPFWCHLIANGTSFAGDIQNKLFYPLTWLCIWLPDHLNFKVFYVLHIAMGVSFAYLFFRNHKCEREISVFGAIVFGFSNLIILRIDHINILCALVWLPLILYFLERFFSDKQKKYIVGMAMAMSMQFFAGFPQTAIYSDIFVALVFLYYCITNKVKFVDVIKNGILIVAFYVGLIAVQLFPLIELMMFSGRGEITYDYFASYSADFRMLLNMLNPLLLGPWGRFVLDAAEFPTDVYIGIVPCTLLVFSFIYMRKDKTVKILYATAILFLVLACACSNIPALGQVIYRIPVLGSFRTNTRILAFFVISELIISVLTLQRIIVENMWKQYRRIVMVMLAIFMATLATIAALIKTGIIPDEVGVFYTTNYQYWVKSIVVYVIIIGILYIAPKVSRSKMKLIPIILAFITFGDTYFINVDPSADIFKQKYMINAPKHEEMMDSQIADEMEKLGDLNTYNYYVSCDSVWVDWERTHLGIKANGNIYRYLRSLQSYITFNNPMLLELSCADYYGMTMNNKSTMAVTNPTLLSMLSAKYIVQYVDNDDWQEYVASEVMYEDYSMAKLSIDKNYLLPIDFAMEEDYHLYGQVDSLNGGGNLILSNGESSIVIQEGLQKGANHFSKVIDGSFLSGKEIYLCYVGEEDASIPGIKVDKIEYLMDLQYTEIYNDGTYKIYRNDDARPLLYASVYVQGMKNADEYIVNNKGSIDFCTYSILEEEQENIRDYSGTNVSINITEQRNDSVKAEVIAEGGNAFINFTQNYYPGWSVYIDGIKSEPACVNGLIQGVEVSEGTHVVEFVYEPWSIWVGMIITVSFVIISVLIFVKGTRRKES